MSDLSELSAIVTAWETFHMNNVPCPYCDGLAEKQSDEWGGAVCHACGEESDWPDPGLRMCFECYGEGHVEIDELAYTCTRCDETGFLPIDTRFEREPQ